MKFIYHKQDNVIMEAATMERPHPNDYNDHKGHYLDDMQDYKNYTASLKSIPCHPSCKTLWEDGKEVEELKDYDYQPDCNKGRGAPFIAFPKTKQESEDELWKEVMGIVFNNYYSNNYPSSSVNELKQQFTIKRNTP